MQRKKAPRFKSNLSLARIPLIFSGMIAARAKADLPPGSVLAIWEERDSNMRANRRLASFCELTAGSAVNGDRAWR
jgi:hypothetical protein